MCRCMLVVDQETLNRIIAGLECATVALDGTVRDLYTYAVSLEDVRAQLEYGVISLASSVTGLRVLLEPYNL